MLENIGFKNYKLFKDWQELELKPITILIGKNSSGKSAILKLPTLIENSLSGSFSEPLRMSNNGVELGGEFKDLIYGRQYGNLEISLSNKIDKLDITINSGSTVTKISPMILRWSLNNILDLNYSGDKNEYINEHNEADYIADFNGFNLNILSLKATGSPETIPTSNFGLNTDYISSLRKEVDRYIEKFMKNYETVGLKGENVYSILIENALTTPKELLKQVSAFYQSNFEGWSIGVNEDSAPPYQIELINKKLKVNIKDVGLGMTQALPLVVRAFMPTKKETLIIIEEPELHLHPAAHGNLAQLFVESLTDKNKKYLIETHSPNFVLRLRRLVAEKKLNKEQLSIYYVEYNDAENESCLQKIEIDDLGKPSFWPKNVFSETLDETSAIRTAQLNR
jgi:AAA15 family ATPase/GTPase